MKYSFAFIACIFLFARCGQDSINVQPTSTYDTLGIHWMTIERTHITYYFQGDGVNGASIYTDMHEDAYVKLDQVFHAKMPQKLRFFVWTNENIAEQLLGSPLGFTLPEECVCHLRANQTLGHEMTHALSYWAGGVRPKTYSRFVSEGVAVAFDLRDVDRIAEAKSALKGQNIHSVTDLWSGSNQSADEEVFYPVAGAFMDFMYKKNLPDQFNALIKNETMEDAENIYGKERLDALIAEFNKLVGL
jgi:hypothetical protein